MNFQDIGEAHSALPELVELGERGRLVERTGIRTLGDLVLVEEYLDSVDGGLLARTAVYAGLQQEAQRFLRSRPELVRLPWVRNGGAIYDLVQRLREQLGLAPVQTARGEPSVH